MVLQRVVGIKKKKVKEHRAAAVDEKIAWRMLLARENNAPREAKKVWIGDRWRLSVGFSFLRCRSIYRGIEYYKSVQSFV